MALQATPQLSPHCKIHSVWGNESHQFYILGSSVPLLHPRECVRLASHWFSLGATEQSASMYLNKINLAWEVAAPDTELSWALTLCLRPAPRNSHTLTYAHAHLHTAERLIAPELSRPCVREPWEGREGVSEIRWGGQMCVPSGDVATLQINRCQATGAKDTHTRTHTLKYAIIYIRTCW